MKKSGTETPLVTIDLLFTSIQLIQFCQGGYAPGPGVAAGGWVGAAARVPGDQAAGAGAGAPQPRQQPRPPRGHQPRPGHGEQPAALLATRPRPCTRSR